MFRSTNNLNPSSSVCFGFVRSQPRGASETIISCSCYDRERFSSRKLAGIYIIDCRADRLCNGLGEEEIDGNEEFVRPAHCDE